MTYRTIHTTYGLHRMAQAEGILGQCIAVDAPWEQVLADAGLEVHAEPE